MIKAAIHQPNHWPYLGFIDKIKTSDIFVIYDTAQFVRMDFQNRNRIRNNSPEGFKWLIVPVEEKRVPLSDIKIDNKKMQKDMPWNQYHRMVIRDLYRKAPGYRDHQDFLDRLYEKQWDNLVDLNMAIIYYLKEVLDIKTPIIKSSDLSCEKNRDRTADDENGDISSKHYKSTMRLIEMCKEVGADTYLSGSSGKDYMMESLFDVEGVKIEYQHFEHPVYSQRFSPFVPNLSALDYIMNTSSSIKAAPGNSREMKNKSTA